MGIFDKAKDFASQNPDKVDGIVDKAGDQVDQRTGGQHAGHVDKAQEFVKNRYGTSAEMPPADAPAADSPLGELPTQDIPPPSGAEQEPPA